MSNTAKAARSESVDYIIIDLSEKKSTGISKILRELKRNGSPMPEFETDADRTYMITTIRIHERFETENENFAQKNERSLSEAFAHKDYNKVSTIIGFMEEHGEITPKEAEALRASLLRQCEDII